MKWVTAKHLVPDVVHVSDSGEGMFHRGVIPEDSRQVIEPLRTRVNRNFPMDMPTMQYVGTFVETTQFQELVGTGDWSIFFPVQSKAWANEVNRYREPMEFFEYRDRAVDVLYLLEHDFERNRIHSICVLQGDIPRAARVSIERRLKKALEFVQHIELKEALAIIKSTSNVDVFTLIED